jgi:glutamate carboxypeptidase
MSSFKGTQLSQAEAHVCEWIASRAEAMLADLSEWVAMPTGPQGGNAETNAALAVQRKAIVTRLEKLGGKTTLVPGERKPTWLREGSANESGGDPAPLAVVRHWTSEPGILLCGHIDTVHSRNARTPAGEAFDRLRIDKAANKAVGPGCSDMKGGLLVAVTALEALAYAGIEQSWGFAIVSDEETGTFANDAALRAEAKAGYRAGLIFEPALPDGSLVIERPGSGQFVIEVEGKAAHVGRDFAKGVSAVTELARAILACDAIANVEQGRIVSVGPLEGGTATNVVPDRAVAWGNMRFMSDEAQRAIEAGLRTIEKQGMPSVRVKSIINRPRKPATDAVKAMAQLAQQCASDLGQTMGLGTTGGVCDGNNLQAGGLPVIDTLGVRGGGLHTTSEWVEISSLVERAQLAALMMMRQK